MSLTVTSQPSFWEGVPFFFGSVPEKNYPTQGISGDWCHVAVNKLDYNGKPIKKVFRYVMENSTGDLYGIQNGKNPIPPSRFTVSLNSMMILLGITPYALCMIAWRPINFLADVFELAINAPSRFISDFQLKGAATALFNTVIHPFCEVFRSLAENIAKVVMTPFYALAMAFAALYGMIIPFEGMKLMSIVEGAWHGNVGYKSDLRCTDVSLLSSTLYEDFKAFRLGMVLFLGFCMQKRGNLEEKIEGKNRFTLIDSSSK